MLQMVLYTYKLLIVIYSLTMKPTVPVFAFQDYRSLHLKPQQLFCKQAVVLHNKLLSKTQCASNYLP